MNLNKKHILDFVDKISGGILICDLSGNIINTNKKLADMFGYKELELKKVKVRDLLSSWEDLLKTVQDSKVLSEEELKVHAKKNVISFQVSAYPLINKKEELEEILLIFEEVRRSRKLEDRRRLGKAIYTFDKIIGQNEKFLEIIGYAKQISDSKSTVLITGESGTGKEVFAQSIHNNSRRKDEAFVAVNCGAIPESLMESEFFGYEEGSFTGAKTGGAIGKFQLGNNGTIFLDEIGEMPLDLQTKLLRVIEEKVINPIGSNKTIPVNVRVIAASNRDLKKEAEEGKFRRDLYYRLNVLPLTLPPIRERRDDIPLLINFFMKKISKHLNKKEINIPIEDMSKFIEYSWPGNVREIENAVEFMINTGKVYLPNNEHKNDIESVLPENQCLTLECNERQHISRVLKKFHGNVTISARVLNIGRNTLYRKIEKYKISLDNEEICSNTDS